VGVLEPGDRTTFGTADVFPDADHAAVFKLADRRSSDGRKRPRERFHPPSALRSPEIGTKDSYKKMAALAHFILALAQVGALTAPIVFIGATVLVGVTYGWWWTLPLVPAVLLVALAWAWWFQFIARENGDEDAALSWWMMPAGIVLWEFVSPFALLLPIAAVVIVGEAFGWRWWGAVAAAAVLVSPMSLRLVPEEPERVAMIMDRSFTLPLQTVSMSVPMLAIATVLYLGLAHGWSFALVAAGPLLLLTPPLSRRVNWWRAEGGDGDEDEEEYEG
jgi:MFS family permease